MSQRFICLPVLPGDKTILTVRPERVPAFAVIQALVLT
ncbi:hypothetical protein M2387_000481 [Klebsiella sp. BIGb0407]|nr:hypothetical protein [Klebsiella sp. BIGb0407]